jgi:uncharacterized protein (TIGR02001 family)
MKLFTASALAGAAALALIASAGSASAQEVTWTANIAGTTDYVFRGFSQTDENPAIQAGVDATIGSFYAGAWASNVDFLDSASAEIDIYGGYRTEVSGFAVDLGVVGYTYVDAPGAADYNYAEFKVAVSRAFGPITGGAAVYYSPDFFGAADESATYGELNAAYTTPITGLSVSGAIGEQWLDVSDDYATWNLGATYAFANSPLALDVRYSDTDVDSPAIPTSDGRVFATLKVTF